MSQQAEILASVSFASPNARANYQGMLGYWVQAEAIFIETLQPEPGAAIAKYRQKLAAGEVAIGHNSGTDALSRISLLQELATQEVEKLELVQELAQVQAQSERYREGFIEWESVAKAFEKTLIEAGLLPPAASPSTGSPAAPFDELGNLYATIFRDGGHRQQELDVLPADPDHNGQPRRYVEAVRTYHALRQQVEVHKEQNGALQWIDIEAEKPPTFVTVMVAIEGIKSMVTVCCRTVQYTGEGWRYAWAGDPKPFLRKIRYWAHIPDFIAPKAGSPAPEGEREQIGVYETDGAPVYEGDNYVIDVEGCYLRRYEAEQLAIDDAKSAAAATLVETGKGVAGG